jgi:hypothetical protein
MQLCSVIRVLLVSSVIIGVLSVMQSNKKGGEVQVGHMPHAQYM